MNVKVVPYRVVIEVVFSSQNLEYSYTFNHAGIIHLVASVDRLFNVTDLLYKYHSLLPD